MIMRQNRNSASQKHKRNTLPHIVIPITYFTSSCSYLCNKKEIKL